jgi:uncharacterized protein YrrD
MNDLGPPVAPLALSEGVPVLDAERRRIGVVEEVVIDPPTGIFDGIVVHTLPLPGRHLWAGVDDIAELHEHGVLLAAGREQLRPAAERPRRRHRERVESPLAAWARKAWDWVSGVR